MTSPLAIVCAIPLVWIAWKTLETLPASAMIGLLAAIATLWGVRFMVLVSLTYDGQRNG